MRVPGGHIAGQGFELALSAAPLSRFFTAFLFPFLFDDSGFTVPVVVVVDAVAAARPMPERNPSRGKSLRDRLWCLNETTRGHERVGKEPVGEMLPRVREAVHEHR